MSYRLRYSRDHPVNKYFDVQSIRVTRKAGDTIMAWNYETGKEEEVAYPHGKSALYTAPKWKSEQANNLALKWEEAEAKAFYYHKQSFRSTCEYWHKQAISIWRQLEMAMLWDKAAEIDTFRRQYVEWLAKATELDVQLGITDLNVDHLPLLERIIVVGYRTLAKTEHPDLGGSQDRFQALVEGKKQLDAILKEVKDLL